MFTQVKGLRKTCRFRRTLLSSAELRDRATRAPVRRTAVDGRSRQTRMLKLTARYTDLWNTGYMGRPETMKERLAKIEAACSEIGRDPATLGKTALIGLWYPDPQAKKPSFFDNPLIGTVQEIAAAMRGYTELGVQHIMFQCEPYTAEARLRLTEALQIYRGMEQQ